MRDYSVACCVTPPAVPANYCCLWPDIVEDYCRLRKRYQKMVTKRQRIWMLSEPKVRNRKYQAQCLCPDAALRDVRIVRMENPLYTRTEQLAYPQVSRLLNLKMDRSFRRFNKTRKIFVNRLLRKSLCSLYSRLANVQPPKHPFGPKKWDKHDWETHMKRIKTLAKPKKDISAQLESNEQKDKVNVRGRSARGGGKMLRRFRRLSRPKKYVDMTPKEWHLTEEMKNYVPTPRIKKMSQPKTYMEEDPEKAYRVKRGALHYKATPRIKEMAEPRAVHSNLESRGESAFTVKRSALKSKTSKRIVELAEPKDYMETHNRTDAFKVSPKALRAKITPRLIELAKPRTMGRN